jgi:mannose-6-phosphate isomerase-like protein (cupin superfamily)
MAAMLLDEDDDEFFLVLDGELVIEVEDSDTVRLGPQQAFTMPKGVMHKTSAPIRTVIVMVERAGVRADRRLTSQRQPKC